MRRRYLAYAALFLSVIGTACADNSPTRPGVEPAAYAPLAHLELADYIQQEIYLILPKGFENVVDARWATVRTRKKSGDMVGAAAHLATLVDWMDKKTSEATPPDPTLETKEQAVARLVLNMMEWLYGNENAPPHEPLASEDVVVQVIPAGQSATVVVPSDHAGFDAGPQSQTEIVVISQESEELYPGQCHGPLDTPRCQVPLFYKFDIQPNTGFVKNSARFAVCMIGGSSAERRPLDYLEDEARIENPEDRPVHHRMTMAHEAPADPRNYVDGGYVEGKIEFLPLAPFQKGFVQCDAPSQLGMSRTERALYAVMQFVGRIVAPKDVYAYDAGAEHLADAASHFNGADRYSQQDLSAKVTTPIPADEFESVPMTVNFSVANWSRRHGGFATGEGATAASLATTAGLYLFDQEKRQLQAFGAPVIVAPMRPDDAVQQFEVKFTLPPVEADGDYFIGSRVEAVAANGEVNAQNNSDLKPIKIKKRKADLAFVGDLTASPTSLYQGETVTLQAFDVKNGGNAQSAAVPTQVILSPNADLTSPLVTQTLSVSALAPDGTAHFGAQAIQVPLSVAPGTYYVGASIDPGNIVSEFNEANNVSNVKITVLAPIVTAVNVTPASASLNVGETQNFSASVTGKGNFATTVNWSSSNDAVATVDANGVAKGVGAGTATIKATSTADDSKSGSAAITVKSVLGNKVFVFGDYRNRTTAAEILVGLGYSVQTQVALPTDLTPYNVIWHVGAFVALTPAEISRLTDFLGKGGGVHLTGERPCCENLNNSLTTLVNAVVVGGGVTVGNQGDINGSEADFSYPFNSTAFGAITTSPNALTNWLPSSPGGMTGVSGANVFATGSSCYPSVDGCGLVVGAVWGEEHLQGGKGRLTLLVDVNWFANSGASTVMKNIQYYLDHGAVVTPRALMAGLSAQPSADITDGTVAPSRP